VKLYCNVLPHIYLHTNTVSSLLDCMYCFKKLTFSLSFFQGPITGQHRYCCYWSSLAIWSSCTLL